jgi:flagellar biosynthesis/type III secretory pathway protein FliH
MTLSDHPKANIDWKLNQLLSASKASRSFVARQTVESPVNKTGFSPWTPRDFNQQSIQTLSSHARPFVDERASGSMMDAANSTDERAGGAEQKNSGASAAEGVLMTAGDLEQIRTAAFEQGKRQARAEFAQNAEDNEQRFGELIDSISAERVDFSAWKQAVSDMSLFIATQVLRAEIAVNPEWHNALVDRCLDEIRRHGNDQITVRLSRVDFEIQHARLLPGHESVTFTPEDRLQPGDVEVEMGATRISELIGTKLEQIAAQMRTTLLGDSPGQHVVLEGTMLQDAD